MLAMSTSWNVHKHGSSKAMLEEIVELGFEWVELGRGIQAAMMDEILKFVKRGQLRISSLHNFCPVPIGINPDVPQFTSHRKDQRIQAIRLTQKTIDYAASLGSSCVILHFEKNVHDLCSHRRLRQLALQGKLYTKQFARVKIREILCRERYSALLEERAIDCLLQLGDYASLRGIRLGIKNRKQYEAFPSEREILALLGKLKNPTFGYWHDFGYAQIREHFTLLSHQEWLDRIGSYTIGAHVHDVCGLDCDHLPPFSGVVDYLKLVPLLPKKCIFVLDVKGLKHHGSAIRKSFELWKKCFPDRQ